MRPLRILQLNNWHQVKGGSDAVYLETGRLLEEAGHQVSWFSVKDPENEECADSELFIDPLPMRPGEGAWKSLHAAGRMVHSRKIPVRLLELTRTRDIEIVHGHCFYHRIGTSFIPALRRAGVPTVITLHDYKIICPTLRMLRDGRVCDECITAPRSVVRHRCVRGSTSQSLLYWLEAKSNQWLRRYSGAAAGFIAPSRFIEDLHVQVGIPEEKIFHVPNFVHLFPTSSPSGRSDHFLFAGRLSIEKGLDVLLEAMEGTDLSVKIAGDGPLRPMVAEAAARCDGVEYLGKLGSEELHKEYARCRALVVPSMWYENASIVVLEAFAASTPVIASDIGGLPEQVQPGKTGWLCPPGNVDALREAMLSANADEVESAAMGTRARELVEENHSPERYLERLVEVYEEVQHRSTG